MAGLRAWLHMADQSLECSGVKARNLAQSMAGNGGPTPKPAGPPFDAFHLYDLLDVLMPPWCHPLVLDLDDLPDVLVPLGADLWALVPWTWCRSLVSGADLVPLPGRLLKTHKMVYR